MVIEIILIIQNSTDIQHYNTKLIEMNQFTTHQALCNCLKLIISIDLLPPLTLLRSASCRARCLMTRQGQICVI